MLKNYTFTKKENKRIVKLVTFGASILERSFDSFSNNKNTKADLYDYGFRDVQFFPRAVGGEDSAALASRIDSVVAEFAGESGVVFIVHAGGNDVTATRPYSAASESEKTNLAVNLQYIVDAIKTAGFECIISPISYRSYQGVPPDSNGSKPYNDAIVDNVIKASVPCWWDESNNKAALDLYSLIESNKNYLDADGIHPNTEGQAAIRAAAMRVLGTYFDRCLAPLGPVSGSNYVIDMGSPLVNQTNEFINNLTQAGDLFARLKFSLGMTGSYLLADDFSGTGSTGKGNAGDSTTSLTNNELLETFWFIDDDNKRSLSVGGLKRGIKGKILFTASRDATGADRVSQITLNGETKDLDATKTPAQIVEFDFTVNNDGRIPFEINRKAGSTFGYLSGIEVIFN